MEQERDTNTHTHTPTRGEDNYWLQRTSPQNKRNLLAQVHELTISNHPPVVSFPGTGSIDGGRSPWDVRGSLANAQCRQVQYHHKTRCSDCYLKARQVLFLPLPRKSMQRTGRSMCGICKSQLNIPHLLSLQQDPINFSFSHSSLSLDKFNQHLKIAIQ